jgi:hypothetical protein
VPPAQHFFCKDLEVEHRVRSFKGIRDGETLIIDVFLRNSKNGSGNLRLVSGRLVSDFYESDRCRRAGALLKYSRTRVMEPGLYDPVSTANGVSAMVLEVGSSGSDQFEISCQGRIDSNPGN